MLYLLLGVLGACALISDAEFAARMDLDGDGVARPADCDDQDATIGGEDSLFVDADGDGYGGTTTASSCALEDASPVGGDCDDADASTFPGALETCNLVDDDCDSTADEGVEPPTWYFDGDGDGYGTPYTTTVGCTATPGYVEVGTDCNDADSTIHPDTLWYPDIDGDGYGDLSLPTQSCEQPAGHELLVNLTPGTDCDDGRADVSPSGQEVCDSANGDEDCDGLIDDGDPSATGQTLWYRDADADGLGTVFDSTTDCDAPSGYVSDRTDCDDADATAPTDCRWASVSVGSAHACGLRSNGVAQCWGYDTSGEATAPSDGFTQVSAGTSVSCGVLASGALLCWGTNYYGQLDVPTGIFTRVSVDNRYACAVAADGTIECWGSIPSGFTVPPGANHTAVDVANSGACALDADGSAVGTQTGWSSPGRYAEVQAGFGCCTRDTAGDIDTVSYGLGAGPETSGWLALSAGDSHACAIASDSSATCWGYEEYGEATAPIGTFQAISAGYQTSCAITSDGFIECWGAGLPDVPVD